MKTHLPCILLGLFFAAALVCGCASAVELTVGTPTASGGADDVLKVPVILINDVDFAAFTASVKTNTPGVSITLDPERPLKDWAFQSRDTGEAINIAAYSLGSTTEPEVHLFTLDVKITDPEVTNVPLDLLLYDVGLADNSILPVDQIKTTNLDNFKLSDTVTATVKSDVKEYVMPTAVPTQTPAVTETRTAAAPAAHTAAPTQTAAPAQTAAASPAGESVTPQNVPATTPTKAAATPGITVSALFGILGAGLILRHKSKEF